MSALGLLLIGVFAKVSVILTIYLVLIRFYLVLGRCLFLLVLIVLSQ